MGRNTNNRKPVTILMAEDDPDDRLMVREAFRESHLSNDLLFVHDGEELMEHLHRRGRYRYDAAESAPRPDLILLDLNMPRKDGREALREIKADSGLRSIPVVVVTTSKAEEDILSAYDLGAAGFITKPVALEDLVRSFPPE